MIEKHIKKQIEYSIGSAQWRGRWKGRNEVGIILQGMLRRNLKI
jgi:hypothetical protein